MVQILVPNQTLTPSEWGVVGAAVARKHQAVDEGQPHDGDSTYVHTPAATGSKVQWFALSNPSTAPSGDTGHVIRMVAKLDNSGIPPSPGPTITVELYQGTTVVRATATFVVNTSTYTEYTYTLTTAEAAAIGNYNTLNFKVTGPGAGLEKRITVLELEVPDAQSRRMTNHAVEVMASTSLARRVTRHGVEVMASHEVLVNRRITRHAIEVMGTHVIPQYRRVTRNAIEVMATADLSKTQPRRVTRHAIEVMGRYEEKTVTPATLPTVLPHHIIANWRGGVSLETAYQVDVTRSSEKGTEERWLLWNRPVRTQSVLLSGLSRTESTRLIMNLARAADQGNPVPVYPDHTKVTAYDVSVPEVLTCDTSRRRFFVGGRVLFHGWSDYPTVDPDTVEYGIISSLTDTTLTLESAPSGTPAVGWRVFPVMDAEVQLQGAAQLLSDEVAEVSFTATERIGETALPPIACEGSDVSSTRYVDGTPVLDIRPTWGVQIQVLILRDGEQQPFGRGNSVVKDSERPRWGFRITFRPLNRTDAWDLLQFLDSLRGRTNDLMVPNPKTMMKLDDPLVAWSKTIDVVADGELENFQDYIEFVALVWRDLTTDVLAVASVASVDSDTWRITLVEPLPSWVTTKTLLSLTTAHRCRSSGDTYREEWDTNETLSLGMDFVELLQEEDVSVTDLYTSDESPLKVGEYDSESPPFLGDPSTLYMWFDANRNVWEGDITVYPVVPTVRTYRGDPIVRNEADFIDDVRVDGEKLFEEGGPWPKPYLYRDSQDDAEGPHLIQFKTWQKGPGRAFLMNSADKTQFKVEDGQVPFFSNDEGLTVVVACRLISNGTHTFIERTGVIKWDTQGCQMYEDLNSGDLTLSTPDFQSDKGHAFKVYSMRWKPGSSVHVHRNGTVMGAEVDPANVVDDLPTTVDGGDPVLRLCRFKSNSTKVAQDGLVGEVPIVETMLVWKRALKAEELNEVGRWLLENRGIPWNKVDTFGDE